MLMIFKDRRYILVNMIFFKFFNPFRKLSIFGFFSNVRISNIKQHTFQTANVLEIKELIKLILISTGFQK